MPATRQAPAIYRRVVTAISGLMFLIAGNVFEVRGDVSRPDLQNDLIQVWSTGSGSGLHINRQQKGYIDRQGNLALSGSIALGLANCDTIDSTSTGMLICGSDDGGGGSTYTAGQGLGLNGTAFSLNSTITGSLLEFTTVSGSTVHASGQLQSSGSLAIEGLAVIGGNLTAGDFICASAGCIGATELGTDSVSADELNATGVETELEAVLDHDDLQGFVANEHIDWTLASQGTIHATNYVDNNTTYTAGQGLTLTSTSFKVNATLTGSLIEFSTVSGATVHATDVLRSSGSLLVEGASILQSTLSVTGNATFDTNTLFVDSSANRVGILTTSPETALEVAGAMSGTTLTVSGLKNCDTIDTDANGLLSCGTDDGGGGGISQSAGDARYVNVAGDTMTGALVIAVTGGDNRTVGLEVFGTASGSHVHAQDLLTSSGGLIVEGTGLFVGTVTAGDFSCSDCLDFAEFADSMTLDATTTFNLGGNTLSIAQVSAVFNFTDDFTINAGSVAGTDLIVNGDNVANILRTDSTNDRVGIGTASPKATLDVVGTASGAIVRASTLLTSSGTLAVEVNGFFGGTVTANDFSCGNGCIAAADLGTDSVSADELNATGVESELEAVLDIDQLQGTIAAGQYGAATVDGDDVNSNIAGRSLTLTAASPDTLDADPELYTETKCLWFENPVAADDFKSIWYAKNAVTITSLWCESDQTVTAMLQVDDGSPADVDSTDLTCDNTPPEDTSLNGDPTMAAGDRLDLDVASVSGSPTWVSICWTFTKDD